MCVEYFIYNYHVYNMEDEKLLISFLNLRREYKCIQFKLDNNIEVNNVLIDK